MLSRFVPITQAAAIPHTGMLAKGKKEEEREKKKVGGGLTRAT